MTSKSKEYYMGFVTTLNKKERELNEATEQLYKMLLSELKPTELRNLNGFHVGDLKIIGVKDGLIVCKDGFDDDYEFPLDVNDFNQIEQRKIIDHLISKL